MDDVLKARRILGIESAEFNYDADEKEDEARGKHSPRDIKQLKKKRKKRLSKIKEKTTRRSDLFKGKDVAGPKREHSRTLQVNVDEFDIDNIEPVVDNEPVDDWNDSDSLDSGRMDQTTKWIGKYTCGACGTSFCNSQAGLIVRGNRFLNVFTLMDIYFGLIIIPLPFPEKNDFLNI